MNDKNSIKKFESLPKELQKKINEAGEEISIGNMFFDHRGEKIIRINEIKKQKVNYTSGAKMVWHVYYEGAEDWEATKWHRYGDEEFDKFLDNVKDGTWVRITRPLSEVMKEANKVISGEISEFTSTYQRRLRKSDYEEAIEKLKKQGTKFIDEGIDPDRVWTNPDKDGKHVYRLRIFNKDKELTIMYLPEAEASSGWNHWDTHERKNRTRFKIYTDDHFLINYDQITLEDVEFYLHSRVDREDYLEMMPVLKGLQKHLREEKENEKHFVRFVADRNESKSDLSREALEKKIWQAIDWWKFKNQWKRAINKDDALALRMIEKKLISKEKV